VVYHDVKDVGRQDKHRPGFFEIEIAIGIDFFSSRSRHAVYFDPDPDPDPDLDK
jgi:hypothetical protein